MARMLADCVVNGMRQCGIYVLTIDYLFFTLSETDILGQYKKVALLHLIPQFPLPAHCGVYRTRDAFRCF